jgi:hypothetical protein
MKMPDWLKKYLLSSAAFYAPPGEGEGGLDENEVLDQNEGEEGDDLAAGQDEGDGAEGTGDEHVDAEGEEGGAVDQPARRPNRAQSRIQALTRTATEAKERADKIERELADMRAEQRAREQRTQQETPEAKATRRALMDPMEVMREDLRESEQRTANLLQQQALQTQETNDKLTYNSILRDAPHLKKYDVEVEKIRLEQSARGIFVPREVLLDLAIGRAARAAAVKAAPRARQQGQQRIAAQQSRPAAARGDAATQRGKQGDSAEKRLENVPI